VLHVESASIETSAHHQRLTVPLTLLCWGVDVVPSAGRNTTRIFLSSTAPFATFSAFCHCECISAMVIERKSATDNCCNAAHFPLGGDRDRLNQELIAAPSVWWWVFPHRLEEDCILCSAGLVPRLVLPHLPCTSTSLPTSMRPELGRTQYLASFQYFGHARFGPLKTYCLGAVVLTCDRPC